MNSVGPDTYSVRRVKSRQRRFLAPGSFWDVMVKTIFFKKKTWGVEIFFFKLKGRHRNFICSDRGVSSGFLPEVIGDPKKHLNFFTWRAGLFTLTCRYPMDYLFGGQTALLQEIAANNAAAEADRDTRKSVWKTFKLEPTTITIHFHSFCNYGVQVSFLKIPSLKKHQRRKNQ